VHCNWNERTTLDWLRTGIWKLGVTVWGRVGTWPLGRTEGNAVHKLLNYPKTEGNIYGKGSGLK